MQSRQFWSKVLVLSLLLSTVDISAFFTILMNPMPMANDQITPPQAPPTTNIQQRSEKSFFEKISLLSGIPWTYLAAVDQYEKTMNTAKKRTVQQELRIFISPN